jgi:hypothetical protein
MASESIDRRQLAALVRVGLKTELRGANNPLGSMMRKRRSGFPPLAGVMIFYFAIGIVLTFVMVQSSDLFVSMLLLCSSIMTFIAITVLLEFSGTILTPDDYAIIGPHPVNSRTFFTAKLINLVIFVAVLSLALGIGPTVAGGIVHHNWLISPVVLLTVLSTALATATFFVIFYTLMLRISSREKMNSLLGYLQLLLIFGFYGIMLVLPQHIETVTEALASVHGWYIYLLPSSWYASWAALIFEGATVSRLIAAAVGVMFLVLSYQFALSRLSIGYAKSLAESVNKRQRVATRKESTLARFWRRFTTPEQRVVSRLIRVQFRNDNRYKVTILSVIPIAALYLYLGARDGKSLMDPFVVAANSTQEPNVLFYLAVGLLPLMIIAGTCYSSAYQAAWVFFANPADRVKLVLAIKRFAILYFCLPFLVVIFAVQAFFFGSLLHSALHSITVLLLCIIVISIMMMLLGKVPFSMPLRKGANTALYFVSFLIQELLIMTPMIIFSKEGYGGMQGYLIVIAVLVVVNLLMSLIQNRIIAKRVAKYEFAVE